MRSFIHSQKAITATRLLSALLLTVCALRATASDSVGAIEGDYLISDFHYDDGSVAALNQHYRTLGEARYNAQGQVSNAVLIMHGTTGSGAGFLSERFAGLLFGSGQLLDASRYYIILPDAIGHGQSSRPSAGEAGAFPDYTYDDVVRAQHKLLTEHLAVDHLRLVTGTSMGGMLSWVWGYSYPEFMDALMPMASLPVEIAGRNRMLRKMIIDAVKNDPDYQEGFYDAQPAGLQEAMYGLVFMVSSPLYYQELAPTRESAEDMLDAIVARYSSAIDANDLVYAFDSSRFYNPAPQLENITAPLLAINSADDQVNPPELGILESHIERLPRGDAVVLPITPLTRGHGTHSLPSIWGPYLARFLQATAKADSERSDNPALRQPKPGTDEFPQAPATFTARLETTEGVMRIAVDRALAPQGADRFYQLLSNGFYDGVHFNRVVPGYIAQFGIHGTPAINAVWKNSMIADDPVRGTNTRGSVAFAMTGPDTRSTQIYINTGDNSRLDSDGFAPFGKVIEGMQVVDRLYGLYGENAGGGLRGGRQGPIEVGGSEYLHTQYPLLDFIIRATVE